ncbi:hypothetical protein ACIQC9_03220 [Brevundimonas sp. NPDC092305]|uniref:hypothetical protein n=1 Tax=Brevundimonas sp. NPDC092305 TaxID=3363957 RepID=UPI003827704A
MLISAMVLALLATGDPDGVIATASATPVDLTANTPVEAPSVSESIQSAHGLTTEQQIDRWISAGPARPVDEMPGLTPWVDDRKPHGEVFAGIGTGGYRNYGGTVSMPIGETGRLDLSYSQTENGYGYAYDPRYSYGGGYGYRSFDDGYVVPTGRSQSFGLSFESDSRRSNRSPGAWTAPAARERPAP